MRAFVLAVCLAVLLGCVRSNHQSFYIGEICRGIIGILYYVGGCWAS